ncbi:hypothetical protein FIBSPDRAFT_954110 [Athelia psychrophila]|uniref:Uncharacterized protein n=1 Tax=Athelia psychrophila TaxID=1759441 RepID=A0A166JJ78_9AGAM|nr:hypothetical protein FIBSPDRAFT_954110 [Fibularhizoctonia sp. CBS 109695]
MATQAQKKQSVSRGNDGALTATMNIIRDPTPLARPRPDLHWQRQRGQHLALAGPRRRAREQGMLTARRSLVGCVALTVSLVLPLPSPSQYDERRILLTHQLEQVLSTGCGGAGNIRSPSSSRDSIGWIRTRWTLYRTRRRGQPPREGANDAALEQLDEHERLWVHYRINNMYSTGRANLTPSLAPAPQDDLEGQHHHPAGQNHLESSGRAGDILPAHSRDPSREGQDGSRDSRDMDGEDKDAGPGAPRAGSRESLGQMWNNLKHHGHAG